MGKKKNKVIEMKTLVESANKDEYTKSIDVESIGKVMEELKKNNEEKIDLLEKNEENKEQNNQKNILDENVKKSTPIIKYISCFIGIIICIFFSIFFLFKSSKTDLISDLTYQESSSTSWQVYYNSPDFYNGAINNKYTFVRKFTDRIKTNFIYNLAFSDYINGKYAYTISAKVVAYTPDDADSIIWETKSDILDSGKNEADSFSLININKTVDINYQDYLNQYLSYRQSSGVSSQARIVLTLVVNSSGEYNSHNLNETGTQIVYIPLADQTYQITSDSSGIDINPKVIYSLNDVSKSQLIEKILGIVFAIIALILLIIIIIIFRRERAKLSKFTKELNKILNTYDNVIVNVEKLPDISSKRTIVVSTFEELMDAQMEVRYPISFKINKTGTEAIFMLVQDDLAWVYTMKESSFNKKD